MSWSVKELVVWLNEVERVADSRSKFDWLEIPPTASSTAIQEAYHAIARTRHPDLFRQLEPAMLDRLVRMYGRITAAYADLKEPEKCAAYLRELRGPRPQTAPPASAAPVTTPPP
ncbi:MAG: DnaJ domain-containing protein, partial [Deltaproteobacteria bacterium]|nr:DnaJ domain-containing protein [Kofleriaceae bacterium]